MLTRSREAKISFAQPFSLKGIDRVLPAGAYRVVTDEELIEGLSFPVYRRVSTMFFAPTGNRGEVEMVVIDPGDLTAAIERDASSQTAKP